MTHLRFKNTLFPTFLFLAFLFSLDAFAQLPSSICSPTGGTRADIISVQTGYRGLAGSAPTFTIPAGATGALITISSHSSVISVPSAPQETLGDEDFITISANLDLVANTSSGVLNFAKNTNTDASGTNLYTWKNRPFGTNVSAVIDKGQKTPTLLNDVTFSKSGSTLTITETSGVIRSSYLVEFTSATTNSLSDNGVQRVVFTGGTPTVKSVAVPANTNLIVINKKGTVRINNWNGNGGAEEGYANERLILDLDNNKTTGYSTVANGASLAFRSTYTIKDHSSTSTNRFLATTSGTLLGDYTGKSTTNTANTSDVGISNPAVYFTGTPAAGGTLTIDKLPVYAASFDDVYIIEFYKRTGTGMSVAFIDGRSAYIAPGAGTTSGTARAISVPAGSEYVFLRQAGNANNTNTEANENSMEAYAVINLKTEKATGYYYQQVGFGDATTRRDDNFGFKDLPLNGTSARNAAYSDGYYSTASGGAVYDISFTLSADKSTLTVTNKFGLVAANYQAITAARFFGSRPDLAYSTLSSDFVSANNGSCGSVNVTVTVCNPGSGSTPGAFPVSFYDKNPTTDPTAKLIHLGNYANAIPQGNCNAFSFSVDLKNAGYNNPNIPIYVVINDNGKAANYTVGNTITSTFTLASLATQDPNSNYIECDYTNNLKTITIVNVMACPTANALTTTAQNPTLTGTWDNLNANANGLSVTVNGVTYTKGTSTELTTSGNTWTLNLSALTLPIATYPVTVVTTNANGTATDATTNELVIKDVGVVYLDLNGLTDNLINGTGIQSVAANQLYVNIINTTTGLVTATVAVAANGSYVMPALPARQYNFQLTTVQGVIGNAKPATSLPTDYVFTGEGVSAAGDGNPNGESLITVVNESTLTPRFGIQKRPTSGAPDLAGTVISNVVQGTRYNPGVFGGFEIPSAAFGGTDDGQINSILISALPATLLSITHGTTTYYRLSADIPTNCPTASCVVFPPAGLSIATNTNGQPSSPISMATVSSFLDGNIVIPYKTVDNANYQSTASTNLTIPMVALKFQAGNWSNGSGTSNQPDLTDGSKTLFWVDNGGILDIPAVVKNLVLYNGVDATVNAVCLTVTDKVENQGGKLIMKAISDAQYGQYLGPEVTATFEMPFETGWHNIGFPVNISASQWATQNNTVGNPFMVNITTDAESNNLRWYNSQLSGGKEIGFYITRNSYAYSSHAYGQWNISTGTDALLGKGWNYFLDPYFSNSNPTTLIATGQTNAGAQSFNTHNNFGGWNLIPNIYPVTLSTNAMWLDNFFGDVNTDAENMYDKVVFIWNPNDPFVNETKGAYIAFDPENGVELNAALDPDGTGDALIAPFQAFYIRRANASQIRRLDVDGTDNFGINPAVAIDASTDPALPTSGAGTGALKTVSIKPSYRSACQITSNYKTQQVADLILLKAQHNKTKSADMLELAFANHYTNEIDETYDIDKLGDVESERPFIFSKVDGHALVINKMAVPTATTTLPMGFAASANNEIYTISSVRNTAGYTLYLEDKALGNWQNLNEGDYSFINNIDYNIERFVLHFNNSSEAFSVEQIITAHSTNAGIQLGFEKVKSPKVSVLVTNLLGQKIYEASDISSDENFLIPIITDKPGVYVVTVYTSDSFNTIKLVH